jgi:hypothetical protein
MWTFFSSTDISFTVHSTDVVITHTTGHAPLWKMWRMSSRLEYSPVIERRAVWTLGTGIKEIKETEDAQKIKNSSRGER